MLMSFLVEVVSWNNFFTTKARLSVQNLGDLLFGSRHPIITLGKQIGTSIFQSFWGPWW